MRSIANALLLLAAIFVSAAACSAGRATSESAPENVPAKPAPESTSSQPAANNEDPPESSGDLANKPKTVRDFFMALPAKYFPIESCEPATDKGCLKAKRDYLKTFLEIEDTANGYLKAGCDGAQSCLEMAIFKKADGDYLIGVRSDFEMGSDSYFIDFANGKWIDVGSAIVEGFSKNNYYTFPRKGTTVEVFEKLAEDAEPTADLGKGKKLYDLEWKNGKFRRVN